jgi:hypothetical protein
MRRIAGIAALGLLVLPALSSAGGRDVGYKVPEAPPLCSAHFCVHYVREGPDAPDLADSGGALGVPDYVDTVSAAAEAARAHHNGVLHWRAPRGDGSLGGGPRDRTDIYLADLEGFASGGTSLDRGGRSAYFELHNRLQTDPDDGEGVWPVVAHEYGHVLENAYAEGMDTWMSEGTAEWLADLARPYSAIDRVFQWAQAPQLPMTDHRRAYSSMVWNHWLASRYGRAGVRKAWEVAASARPRGFAPAAYDKALRNLPGPGFLPHGLPFWREFALLAATSAEWRTKGAPVASVWPDVRRQGMLARGQTVRRRLDHLAYELWDVPASGLTGPLTLRVRAVTATRSAVALVGRRAGKVTTSVRYLPRGGAAQVRLENAAGFERITAVLVNADPAARAGVNDWHYLRDNRLIVARLI